MAWPSQGFGPMQGAGARAPGALVARPAAAHRWICGAEVSRWSIDGEGQRHQARLGRRGITLRVGRQKRPEAVMFVGGRVVRWSPVAGVGPCSILESRGW
jgi:hypothetical protein